ncbi:RNA ligase RtcB family protein [Desulfobacterales bacterium HSG17]|nr:RNA ligase RtcB family protein [Desulfobacterales bacterium HSG17]
MIIISEKNPSIKLFVSDKNQIEGDAVRQLQKTAELEGTISAAGLPDLHPGKGGPVGAAFLIQDFLYPFLIGSDVGCGMLLCKTGLKQKKIKRDKWAKKLSGLEQPWDGNRDEWLEHYNLASSEFDNALGTIGGGNHFAELQAVEKIYDKETFSDLNLDKNYLNVLIHSGSRGLGASLLRTHTDKYRADGFQSDSQEALQYLNLHDEISGWAKANRDLIAHRFVLGLGAEKEIILDFPHNSISAIHNPGEKLWLHRKGAVPSDQGPVIIPGTRGTLTYLVLPTGDQSANLWSLAHGAGRKWNRKSTKDRLKKRFNAKSFTQTDLGSIVICEDKDLLYQEAPQAYKNIDRVIDQMVSDKLIKVIATFKPVITYKMRTMIK